MMRLLTTCAATALCTFAVPAAATDLADAYAAAVMHDPDHAVARAARDAGDEADVQARALKRPSLQAQGGYQYNAAETNARLPEDLDPYFSGSRSGSRAGVGVQAVQPIYDAAKSAQATQLHEKAASGRVQFEGEQQELILRVAQAYFAVLSAQDALSASSRQYDAAEEQRRGAQARFEAGRARITDVREAEARRDASAVSRIADQSGLAIAQASFAELTGLPGTDLARPRSDLVPALPPVSLEEATDIASRSAPNVRIAEHAARAAGADIERYSLAGRPVVEGVASYQGQYRLGGADGNAILPDRIQTASVGLRLTVPLYAGGGITSKQREAEALATQAMHQLEAARRDARLQTQKAWYAVHNGARQIAALTVASVSSHAQQDAATTGREVGIRTQKDVLDAQSQTIATGSDRLNAIYAYLQARLQLDAAMGRLDEDDLRTLMR
ncbi:TolC family outer membrane protein [Novosphingobium sp. 1949]|uniref:TolC family outer membrane protein n=1 Tax=Novosphingobium organovorum TaxID=2930092 RepID=A0ABT0BFG0_9SPHN|nr:TolC family outer membrane protein [Novosphingobium organovorum]MCJ2183645.1 TolC family outer membrane protein [Novosphingobium organovorum]